MFRLLFVLTCCCFLHAHSYAQQDTIPAPKIIDSLSTDTVKPKAPGVKDSVIVTKLKDTAAVKKRSPARTAALFSAVLPGAGQAYNKKYWKMPLVYGALAIPVYTFTYNVKWFNRTRTAYNALYLYQTKKDSSGFAAVDPLLMPRVRAGDLSGIKNYRTQFRRDVDYSVLAFLLLWGLNVVDAAVDGHMKDFNVSDDLSIQLSPGFSPGANTAGLSIIMKIGKRPGPKHLYATR